MTGPAILRLAAAPLFFAVLATVALAIALAGFGGAASIAPNGWLLLLGALVLWFCWRLVSTALPTGHASAFDHVRDRPTEPPTRLSDIVDMEGLLLDAEWSWSGAEHALRPVVRRIAAARLLERHQLDLESQPEASRRVLGEELWRLVGPDPIAPEAARADAARPHDDRRHDDRRHADRPRPARPGSDHRRGMPRADIERAIELLEAL